MVGYATMDVAAQCRLAARPGGPTSCLGPSGFGLAERGRLTSSRFRIGQYKTWHEAKRHKVVIPEKIGLTIDIHLDEIQINIYDPTNLYIEYLFQCPM